jgi:hypothetical protein
MQLDSKAPTTVQIFDSSEARVKSLGSRGVESLNNFLQNLAGRGETGFSVAVPAAQIKLSQLLRFTAIGFVIVLQFVQLKLFALLSEAFYAQNEK